MYLTKEIEALQAIIRNEDMPYSERVEAIAVLATIKRELSQ